MYRIVILILFTMSLACSNAKTKSDSTQGPLTPSTPVKKETVQVNPKADPEIVKSEVCELGKDSRVIEIRKKTNGCELIYTKFGKSKVVSSGVYGVKHCEETFEKITKKLEAQKYKCGAN